MNGTPRLDALQARASNGAPDAVYELAVELLRPDTPDADPLRAVELVRASSDQGYAPATERRAVFTVMGIDGAPDWDRALDLLVLAAQQGSLTAGPQLLMLAGHSADASGERLDSQEWQKVRQSIDIAQLLHAGDRRFVSDRPRIRVMEGFASAAECGWLIAAARPRLKPATVFDKQKGGLTHDSSRNNSAIEFHPHDTDLVTEMLRCRIAAATKVPLQLLEPSQILHYAVGQQFTPHYDFLDPANAAYREQLSGFGQRIATFLVYLSEDYEGGETQFPAVGFAFKGRTGDAIFWANLDGNMRPDRLTLHAGLPPSAGEKWVLSQWIRERVPER